MEFLNSIWTALTTPNTPVVNILSIPFGFIEYYLFVSIFLDVLEINYTKKQKIICILLISFLSIINLYILPTPYNVLLNYFVTFIIAYVIFKTSLLKSSICIVISGIIFNIIGALVLNPYITIFNISSDDLAQIPIYRLLYMCLIYFIIGIIYIFLKFKNFKIHFTDTLDKSTKFIITANIILGIATITLQSIMLFYYIDSMPIIITFFNFISFLSYFFVSIYGLTRSFKLISTNQKLQSAEEYNNTLRILHDSVRGFKHDFDNIVTTIGGYIRTNDMKGLQKYYLELEDDCQKVNNLYILNPDIINNDGIYNLLTKKYNEAESKNIKVNITFLLDLSNLNMKIYEFARILGILLDNAIEASSACDEKIINLTFRDDSKNSRQLICIENTYANKDIDTDKIFEKGISEKENHMGLGLWEVRKIIKKYNNINLFTSKTDKYFSQQLEIYYKN